MAKKILVVDDEADIVDAIAPVLQQNNYEVMTAKNGEECLNKVINNKPDLVLLDLLMPKIDGYSVLVALKQASEIDDPSASAPDVGPIHVIVITAHADQRVRDLVEKEKVSAYIIKPFELDELLSKIKAILGE